LVNQDLKDVIERLQEMEGGLGQLQDLMESTQTVSDSLLKSFKEFATAGSSSTLWSAVSRFSSGIFPGFWSLQNKVRAVAVYMQYVEKKQKEQIKKESEIAKTINAQAEARSKAAKTLQVLNSNNISAMEYTNLLEDDYFKSLVARLGKEEALTQYKKVFNKQMRESLAMEVKLAKQVKENIEGNILHKQAYKDVGLANRDNLTQLIYFTEQQAEKEERLNELMEERKGIFKDTRPLTKAGTPDKRFKNTAPQTPEELSDSERELYDSMTKAIEELTTALEGDKAASEFISRRTGISINQPTGGVIKGKSATSVDIQEGEEDQEKEEQEGVGALLKSGFIKKFNGIHKVTKAIFVTLAMMKKNNIMKSIRAFLRPAIAVMASLFMWITIAGLLVFSLIQSGIMGKIIELYEWFKESEWLETLVESVMTIWEGISEFFTGMFDFIYGLFSGDLDKVIEGLTGIFTGAFKMVMGLVDFGINLLLGWLYDLFPGLFDWWNETAKPFLDKFDIDGDKLVYLIKSLLAITAAYYIAGGGYTGAAAAAAVGIGAYMAYAGGGRVNQDGFALVGEAGPEIISLPKNSVVTPRVQSKGMIGNNITVNVNGRVGASDAELNEIARKIGQKINREMNKYGSSGYRA